MHEVVLNKHELLSKLRDNRKVHKEAFSEALAGYRQKLRQVFVDKIEELDAGETPDTNTGLPKPSDHTGDYDHIIQMVDMSVQNELKLSAQEFAMYVMDNWSWKQSFTATNMAYR